MNLKKYIVGCLAITVIVITAITGYNLSRQKIQVGLTAKRVSAFIVEKEALSDDPLTLSRSLKETLGKAERSAKSKTNRAISPQLNYHAALIAMKLNQISMAERCVERALAQMAAFNTDIARRIYDDASLAYYIGLRTDLEKLLVDIRRVKSRSRPSESWIKDNIPWLIYPDKNKRDTQNALLVVKNYERVYATNWSYRQKNRLIVSPPHMELARAYRQLGMLDKAIIEGMAAVETGDKGPITWSFIGWTYLKIGALERAADAFDIACKMGDREICALSTKVREAQMRFVKQTKTLRN